VFEGTPADLVAAKSTLTGEHLAVFIGTRPKARPFGKESRGIAAASER
jgi:hypothetical protein